jgi:hypothetical protein
VRFFVNVFGGGIIHAVWFYKSYSYLIRTTIKFSLNIRNYQYLAGCEDSI